MVTLSLPPPPLHPLLRQAWSKRAPMPNWPGGGVEAISLVSDLSSCA